MRTVNQGLRPKVAKVSSWIPANKIFRALALHWPPTLLDLSNWAINDAPSIYHLLQTREVVECLIRAQALDAVALAHVENFRPPLRHYMAEPIERKMEALELLNIRISQLGLETPADVSGDLRP